MASFGDSDIISLCLIVNTAYYVASQCERLQGNLHSICMQIEDKEMQFNEKMDKFEDSLSASSGNRNKNKCTRVEDAYHRLESVINWDNVSNRYNKLKSSALNLIANGIGNKVGFLLYKSIDKSRKWGDLERTDDKSSFVSLMKAHVVHDLTIVHKLVVISESQQECKFGLLHRHLVDNIIPKYISGIFKIKKVNEQGAHQLQIDTQIIRTILINLLYVSLGGINDIAPKNGARTSADEKTNDVDRGSENGNLMDISDINRNQVSKIYGKNISKQMSTIEGLLKTVAARHENVQMLADTFESIMYDTRKKIYGNVLDLKKICELKGLKVTDVEEVTRIYNRMAPPDQQMKQSIVHVEATKTDILNNLTSLFTK